jgi:hypothetical protein
VARFLASRVAPDAERSLVVAEAHRTFRLDFAKEPHTEMAIFRPASPHADANGEAAGTHVLVDRQVIYEDNPLRKELVHFVSRVRGIDVADRHPRRRHPLAVPGQGPARPAPLAPALRRRVAGGGR